MTTKELADHYGIKYVSLQEYGVYSVAFLPDEALRMVNILREEVTPILGGDVYVKKNSPTRVYPTDDGWYYERKCEELIKEYTDNSCDEAIKYIQIVLERLTKGCYEDGSDVLFDLVILDLNNQS